MAEDNVCSYCKVKAIREQAEQRGRVVRIRRSTGALGGVMIYVVPPNTPEDKTVDGSSRYFYEWVPSINDTCTC